ncbi:MAG TPA: FHA domain-containing protein [Polyangiaceae bacterium]|nr:FHA domain-containing protein [Polyangiaceae bacterium]
MSESNTKTPRTFLCRDTLWKKFEEMAKELECSVDYLVNDAMKQYARQRGYAGAPLSQSASLPPPAPAAPGANGPISSGTSPRPLASLGAPVPPPQRAAPPPAPVAPPALGALPAPHAPPSFGAPPAHPVPPPPAAPPSFGAPPSFNAPPSFGAPTSNQGPVSIGAPPTLPQRPGPPPVPSSRSPLPPPPIPVTAAPLSHLPPPPAPGALPRTSDGHLLYVLSDGEQTLVDKDRFVIGRGKQSSDLTIRDPNVSRQHAVIEYSAGVFYMVDMGSTNGIEFAGQRVQRKAIQTGDIFKICDHELVMNLA